MQSAHGYGRHGNQGRQRGTSLLIGGAQLLPPLLGGHCRDSAQETETADGKI